MTKRQTGLVLRLIGPVIQVVGLALFLNGQAGGKPVLGVRATVAGLSLVAMGFVVVVAGLAWPHIAGRRRDKDDEGSDYDLRL